jgi:hypothetical protein
MLCEKISVEISDDIFVGNNDPAVISFLSNISTALTSQNSLISSVVSEIECLKLTVNDLQSSYQADISATSNFPPLIKPNFPPPGKSVPVSGISSLDNRRPLKQAPIGHEIGTDVPWNQVGNRKSKRGRSGTVVDLSDNDNNDFAASAPPH